MITIFILKGEPSYDGFYDRLAYHDVLSQQSDMKRGNCTDRKYSTDKDYFRGYTVLGR